MELTPIDTVLLFLILGSGIYGLLSGAVKLAGPFAFILALVMLTHAYPEISAHFGTDPAVNFFLCLFWTFIGLVVYACVVRLVHGAVHASGLGPFNHLLGGVLGLVTGTIMAGALVWSLQTSGGIQGRVLLHGSSLAPAVLGFLQAVLAFTSRLLPRLGAEKEPWWKRVW